MYVGWLKLMMIMEKSLFKTSTKFVVNETDVSVVQFQQVLGILPKPEIKEVHRKIVCEFPGFVAVYEK